MKDDAAQPAGSDLSKLLEAALAPSYLLVRELGRGGMGTVYLARDPALKRLVAVKVLAPKLARDKRARVRFEREAQAAASISHPNVVSVYSVGELADGTPYFVMRHVEGPSLEERLETEGSLGLEEGTRLIGAVASGLAAAHQKGIVHRDVKPSNILCDAETGRALISDFGIASALKAEDAEATVPTRITESGMVVGTPAYMSPEQLLGDPVTAKSDVYNLGLVAYEVLAGRGPFDVASARERMAAVLRDQPKKLSELVGRVDPELEAVLFTCLAREPEKRPDAGEIATRFSPKTGTLLEWPPPGLESLQGALWKLVAAMGVGSGLLVLPLLALVASSGWPSDWPFYIAAGLGGVIFASTLLSFVRLAWRAAQRTRAGFTLLTVCEVLADGRGDSGQLIAGTREYAALEAPQRGRLRQLRFLRAAALLAAALWPALGFAAAVFLAVRSGLGWKSVALGTLGPALGLGLFGLGYWLYELRAVRLPRRSLRRDRDREETLVRLVGPWYESFDRVRGAQRQGQGRHARPLFVWAPTAAVAAFCLTAAVLAISLPIVTALHRVYWGAASPRYARTLERVALAELLRPYRLAPDPEISAGEAGRALQVVSDVARSRPYTSVERPAERRYERAWLPGQLVADANKAFGTHAWVDAARLVPVAVAGLTADQRAVLEEISSHPANAEYTTVARAAEADFLAARFRLPFPDDIHPAFLPIPRFSSFKDAAYAHVASAALAIADGRPEAAENSAREIISHGLLLLDEASFLLEGLIGVVIAGIGRETLRQVYLATGRADEALAISAAVDSLLAGQDTELIAAPLLEPVQWKDIESSRLFTYRMLSDTTITRSLRLENLLILQYSSCTTLRSMLFGPSDVDRRAMQGARRSLVRRPSDAALIDLMEQALTRPLPPPEGLPLKVVDGVVGILGGQRARGCLRMSTLFSR